MEALRHFEGWFIAFLCIVFIILLIKYRNHFVLKGIIDDTLKIADPKTGILKWSRTSLTMATAWAVCLYSYLYDLWNNGFNETAFYFMGGIALGAKITDAWSKKIDPTIVAPPSSEITKSDTTIKETPDSTDISTTVKKETE